METISKGKNIFLCKRYPFNLWQTFWKIVNKVLLLCLRDLPFLKKKLVETGSLFHTKKRYVTLIVKECTTAVDVKIVID